MDDAYSWDLWKNVQLLTTRRISFEDIVDAIAEDGLLDVIQHKNQERYPGQRIFVVFAKDYVHLVPFVIDAEGRFFLKTVIPSRKAYRDYIGREP